MGADEDPIPNSIDPGLIGGCFFQGESDLACISPPTPLFDFLGIGLFKMGVTG